MAVTASPLLERYRPLIDDWPAFCEVVRRPLPTCVWANPLRVTPEHLLDWWNAASIPATPLPWLGGAFSIGDDKPGTRLPFWAGAYHVQEAVSMLPALFMGVRPQERILDLCAAPGNKSAQLAVALGGTGLVVANDLQKMRLKGLRGTADRLGLTNLAVTVHDAADFPLEAGPFDRVLADVPCSCEGTTRKHPRLLEAPPSDPTHGISRLQRAILRRAVELCKPGGRIVYSTCTYAPEENEAVVHDVLEAYRDVLELRPISFPGMQLTPGLTQWEGQVFDAALSQTARIWPHHNDTGGFFIAVFDKRGRSS